ncbi:hypothetical protein Btus_0300 [Kyrpidia tusciae DSM 2912]|uniref:Uncharacterized protein n=1 Tax=Kyrpidia tusciae (strain DSM 2912 / NBRC 15312 / T2) TaxID=562970 RepID=D5WSW9_KYRT2|nr:hypothetical protein Btus_0300 [Kyrpidia tusciae DSM 2912]
METSAQGRGFFAPGTVLPGPGLGSKGGESKQGKRKPLTNPSLVQRKSDAARWSMLRAYGPVGREVARDHREWGMGDGDRD